MRGVRVGCIFYFCFWRFGFWFRIFGKGIAIDRDAPKLFSERHGFRKVRRWRRWSFEVLK